MKLKWTKFQKATSFVYMFEAYGASLNKAKMPQQKSRISWNLFFFPPYKESQAELKLTWTGMLK